MRGCTHEVTLGRHRDSLDWPPWLTACPRLTEIAEDVFESFNDDDRELPGAIRHRCERWNGDHRFVRFLGRPRT